MTTISPSLLACDFTNIEKELMCLNDIENLWLHLDIMDGHFVPNLTFGQPIIKNISQRTQLPLDAHLMVTNPEFYIESLKGYNIHNFTFHIEATDNPLNLLKSAKEIYPSVGISLKPSTDISELTEEVLSNIDLLLVMSVEPGFGGQGFIESTWDKLKAIADIKREKGLKFEIQIDGGVSNLNSQKLIDYGATNLVAGSYIFKGESSTYKQKIKSLR